MASLRWQNNNYFIEIGSADGLQNNTSWLLITNNFQGLMVEGNKSLRDVARRHIIPYGIGTIYKNIFIELDNVDEIKKNSTYLDPDLFSVDIDGNDYHIVKKLFEIGFRPKVFVVEYNSSYGPTKSITIKYRSKFTSKNRRRKERGLMFFSKRKVYIAYLHHKCINCYSTSAVWYVFYQKCIAFSGSHTFSSSCRVLTFHAPPIPA